MIVTVDLPDELYAELARIAEGEGHSTGTAIRIAIDRYLSERSRWAKVHELAAEVAHQDAELLNRLAER